MGWKDLVKLSRGGVSVTNLADEGRRRLWYRMSGRREVKEELCISKPPFSSGVCVAGGVKDPKSGNRQRRGESN